MSTPIVFDNTVFASGELDAYPGMPQAQATVADVNPYPITINGTVNKVGDTVTATGNSGKFDETLTVENFDNSTALEFYDTEAGVTFVVSNNVLTNGEVLNFQ